VSSNPIGQKVKKLRELRGFTQAELAKAATISPAAVSLIEKGERTPSLIITRKLSNALKVSIGELTGNDDKTTQDIDLEAQAFFRNFGDIADLEEGDQEIIKTLAKQLKERRK
jgi:transcriptional regulator with XRE-family HTH domain